MSISAKLNYISLVKNIPLSVTFEVTRRCNLNCVHCYLCETHGLKKIRIDKELSLKEILDIFRQLKKSRTIFLNITGGEPLLRNDIEDIIFYAIKLNFSVKLFSSLYGEFQKRLNNLYKKGLREIDVSLYGRKKTHNFITGRNSFDVIIANIIAAKNMGFKITIKTPVMNINLKEISWVYRFANENRFGFKIDPTITPLNDGNRMNEKYQINSETDFKAISTFENFSISQDESFNNIEYFACGAGRNVLGINSYGDVYPCLAFPEKIGNLKNEKLIEILNSKKIKKIRKTLSIEPEKCLLCNYKNYCSRCPAIAYLYGDVFQIYKTACDLAKLSAKKSNFC
ncbi:MAG: radical SAM protein [Elusimicrobiota bacterium]